MTSGHPKRNQLIVDASVQWMLVRRMMLHWFAFLAASLSICYGVGVSVAYFRGGTYGWNELLAQQMPFLGVTVLMLPIFTLDTITLSHRFVGPMFRFRAGVRDLLAGEVSTRLSFRPGDYWQDISRDFNLIADRMSKSEYPPNQLLRPSVQSSSGLEGGLSPHRSTTAGSTQTLRVVSDASEAHSDVENRKRTYVDRHMQGGMLARIVGHWLAYLSICVLAGSAFQWMLDPLSDGNTILQRMMRSEGLPILTGLVLFPLFAWDTIRLTHRIAGPIYRIRRELRQLAVTGSAARVTFRPNDVWHDVAHEFNALCDKVADTLDAMPREAAPEVDDRAWGLACDSSNHK